MTITSFLMLRLPFILSAALILSACQSRKDSPSAPDVATAKVELLEQNEGNFTLVSSVDIGPASTDFTLGDTLFSIIQRWPHSESTLSTTDENPEERHAIEVSWTDPSGAPHCQWIYQRTTEEPETVLPGISAAISVAPPGARPPAAGDAPLQQLVQFLYQNHHHNITIINTRVFPSWKVAAIQPYQHALPDDQGELTEDSDSNSVNRAIQVNIVSDDGTEERHIAFIDHPELTRGVHPAILPVKRVRGEGASQSRLVVRTPMTASTELSQILVTPVLNSQALEIRILPKGSVPTVFQVTELPAEITLPDGILLRLIRHFAHAIPQVKWERRDLPATSEACPALVIEQRSSPHLRNELVLVRDQVTSCRIGEQFLLLRYADKENP